MTALLEQRMEHFEESIAEVKEGVQVLLQRQGEVIKMQVLIEQHTRNLESVFEKIGKLEARMATITVHESKIDSMTWVLRTIAGAAITNFVGLIIAAVVYFRAKT